jgi:hypothetical protein
MRYLGITQNPDTGNTALSQPGLQKRPGEAAGASVYSGPKGIHFFAFNFGLAIFARFHSVNLFSVQVLKIA